MSLPNEIHIGLVQMACADDPQDNLDRAVSGIRTAAGQGARVICLQELFRRKYLCQIEDAARFDWAEPVPGPATDAIGKVARELEVAVVAPLFERRAKGVYHNSAAIIDADGSLLGVYRKMHIPDDPLYYEKFYFAPGDSGFQAFKTRYGTIGVLICWDQWFPEAARLTALRGAEVIFYPTAIGWHPSEKAQWGERQHAAWQTVQRGHAVANGCYVAAVNRVGHEKEPGSDGIEFWGRSFVAGPMGEMLTEAEAGDGEQVLIWTCDLSYIEEVRRGWPFLRDRRVDAYDQLSERWIDS